MLRVPFVCLAFARRVDRLAKVLGMTFKTVTLVFGLLAVVIIVAPTLLTLTGLLAVLEGFS
jgi:hypothetical protein